MKNKKILNNIKELEIIDTLGYGELENTTDFKKFNIAYDNYIKEKKSMITNIFISILIIILVIFTIVFSMWCDTAFNSRNIIKNIDVTFYDEITKEIDIKITINSDKIYQNISCSIGDGDNNLKWVKSINNTCEIKTKIEDIKNIYLKNKEVTLNPYKIDDLFVFGKFINDEKIFLSLDGKANLESELIYVGKEPIITYKPLDGSIIKVDGKILNAQKEGSTIIELYINDKKYDEKQVVVTSLIVSAPKHFNYKKSYLACRRYNEQEANMMDEILYNRIDNAGYKTRAGVVAAARFLTLEFPYRIDYFFENGRVNNSGVNYADGEGRYYHRGLYLHSNKYKDIKYVYAGPVIWGCPLTNFEDFGKYVNGKKMPNGLDCSGFVTWTLLNGGFDVGDYGAGETAAPNQMTDLGKRVKLTKQIVDSGVIKVGDLLNWWGHIAIIIGIDDTTYYVAESLDTYEGLVMKEYKKNELHTDWTFVMLMDSVYQEDGNITNMWY